MVNISTFWSLGSQKNKWKAVKNSPGYIYIYIYIYIYGSNYIKTVFWYAQGHKSNKNHNMVTAEIEILIPLSAKICAMAPQEYVILYNLLHNYSNPSQPILLPSHQLNQICVDNFFLLHCYFFTISWLLFYAHFAVFFPLISLLTYFDSLVCMPSKVVKPACITHTPKCIVVANVYVWAPNGVSIHRELFFQ